MTRLPQAREYAALLATTAVERGLIGPREVPRLWQRHLLNCAVVGEELAPGTEVADVGSGAGLPGIVLAIARPDLRVTLVEPVLRRVTFLTEVVAALELVNVEVVRARAEELHGVRRFPVVTSRAVAPLGRLAGWCLPLLEADGTMIAIKGASALSEVTAAAKELDRLGAGPVQVHTLGVGVVDPPTTVIRVDAGGVAGLGWDIDPHPGSNRPTTPRKGRRR